MTVKNYCPVFFHTPLSIKVLDLQEQKCEWGFKALKQCMKLNFKLVSVSGIL